MLFPKNVNNLYCSTGFGNRALCVVISYESDNRVRVGLLRIAVLEKYLDSVRVRDVKVGLAA